MIVTVYYGKPPEGFLAKLQREGATHAGVLAAPRAPIEILIAEAEIVRYATILGVASPSWTATVMMTPLWAIQVERPDGDRAAASALLDQLAAAGELDFGVCDEGRSAGLAGQYMHDGPRGLGLRTLIGPRVAGLMAPAALAALGGVTIELPDDAAERSRLQRAFADSGVAARIGPPPLKLTKPGPRWAPPPAAPAPATPSAHDAKVINALYFTAGDESIAKDLEAEGLVAPFSALANVKADRLELERAQLAFSDLEGSQLDDVGLVGADLRGIDASNVHWVEVSLVEADLRWSMFRGADLPLGSLERARCEGIDFTGADLRGVMFDGADLTNAVLRDADLRDASLRGCVLAGCDLGGANTEGTLFDAKTS